MPNNSGAYADIFTERIAESTWKIFTLRVVLAIFDITKKFLKISATLLKFVKF